MQARVAVSKNYRTDVSPTLVDLSFTGDPSRRLKVGERVEGYFEDDDSWTDCIIKNRNPDGTSPE